MVEAHVAHAVDGSFDVFNGIPRELALGDLRQFLVELVVQLEKSRLTVCGRWRFVADAGFAPAGSTGYR